MSAVFGFRLPEDLRQYLQEQARHYRTTVSHYLVTLVLEDMRKEERKSEEVENGRTEDRVLEC